MKYNVRIETVIKNGEKRRKGFLDGKEMSLFELSEILTGTIGEWHYGVFTTEPEYEKRVKMETSVEEHEFDFSGMSYPERIRTVREYFSRNDKKMIEEFEIEIPEE